MTLTPEQKARKKLWIQKNGLDPEQFDYDVENDIFVPRTPTAEQQPQEVVPPDGSSPIKTAVKAAAYNLPEATGGLAAAGAGAMAGAPLGPIGSIAGGLIGGFGGSALAGKAKEAALDIPFVRRAAEYLGMSPEEMAKEQQTNPKAYLAGELGSNLPFFSVSGGIRGVGRAAGALRSLPLPTRMPAQDIAALGNVAIGAGLGAGQSIGSDLISGRDINWGQAAAQTAAGALLNSPRRLGTMVSLGTMHPMPGDEIGARFNEASRLAQDATPVKPPTAAAPATEPVIPEAGGIRFPVSIFELKKLRAPNAEKLGEPEIATVGSRTMSFGDQEKLAKWQKQQVETERRTREYKLAQAEKNKQDARQILREAGEPFPEEGAPQDVVPVPATPEKLTHTRVGTDVTRPEIRPENPVDQLMGEAEPRSEAEILQDEMEGTGARYSPAKKKAPVTTEPVTFSSEAKPPAEPESQLPAGLVAAIQHLGGKKYRTNVEVTGDPIVMRHAQEGVPAGTLARGVMQPRENPAANARIRLSRQLGLPETPAHELIEGVISDLQTHGNKSEKNFLKRFADSFGGLDAAIDAAASDFTGQLRDPSKGGIIQDWTDFIKYKMGRASRQEMARLMSNVLRRGAGAEEVLPRIQAGTMPISNDELKEKYSPLTDEQAKTIWEAYKNKLTQIERQRSVAATRSRIFQQQIDKLYAERNDPKTTPLRKRQILRELDAINSKYLAEINNFPSLRDRSERLDFALGLRQIAHNVQKFGRPITKQEFESLVNDVLKYPEEFFATGKAEGDDVNFSMSGKQTLEPFISTYELTDPKYALYIGKSALRAKLANELYGTPWHPDAVPKDWQNLPGKMLNQLARGESPSDVIANSRGAVWQTYDFSKKEAHAFLTFLSRLNEKNPDKVSLYRNNPLRWLYKNNFAIPETYNPEDPLIARWLGKKADNEERFTRQQTMHGPAGQTYTFTFAEMLPRLRREDLVNGINTSIELAFNNAAQRIGHDAVDMMRYDQSKIDNVQWQLPSNFELLDTPAKLVKAGEHFQNCIASYVNAVRAGHTHVIKISNESAAEISPNGDIIQHRGMENGEPPKADVEALKNWREEYFKQSGGNIEEIRSQLIEQEQIWEEELRYSPAEDAGNTKNTIYAEYFRRMKEAAANARYSPAQEESSEFKKWFEGSKVVTPEGKPLVVYHGTQKGGFTEFWPASHFGTVEQANNIIGPTSEKTFRRNQLLKQKQTPDWSSSYSFGINDAIYPVYINIKNPKRVRDVGHSWETEIQRAKKEGFDGIVYENKHEGEGDSWIPLDSSTQVKSAIGNSGMFDPANPDIRYSPAPDETQNPTYAEYFRRMKEAAANAKPVEVPAERELPARTPEQRIEDRRAGSAEHVNWRYSPASDRFGQINNPDEIKGEGFSFFTPLTEKLARSGNAMKEHFAKKFLDLTNKQREMWGGWMNGMLEARGNLSPQEWNNVYHALVDEGRRHVDLSARLNPNELNAYHKIRTIYQEMGKNRLAAGQLVSGRAGGVDPYGMFEVIDRDVLRVMLEHANTPQAQQLRQEFIDHQVNNGVTPAKAEQKLKTLLGHFGEITDLQNNFKFNAVRTPEGVGLPDSWIEKDFDAAIRRYTRRFATDRAFFDVMEKDPRMMSALGATEMANGAAIPAAHAVGPENLVGGDPAVRTLLASYIGTDLGHREPFHASLGRFVNSLILGGPITKLTDLGSVPFHALRYVRTQDIPGLLASMANWKNGYANAFKTGLNKRGGLIVATEILGAHEQAARALDRAAEFVTKATGSEQLELLSRGLAQAMGEFVGRTQRGLALGGDRHAKAFLEKLGSDWETASPEELGTRVAKLMQGRYDLTNMPAWMRTSPIAPFFSMMRWSVEQWNNFRNFAVQPAMHGDMMPLAHSLIGAVAGGALINQMREQIAGKKPYTATEEELNAASAAGAPGVDKERIYKWIAAANITGTMGIVGELTRQLYELTTSKTPQGFQYPVAGVLQDIGMRGASAMAAIHDGEDPAEIAGQYVKDIAKDNVQIIRLAMNAYARMNPESEEGRQLEYKNRRRDVTMFNSLYGYPVSKSPKAFPEYSGQSERELDAEQDPQKAARLATSLTQRAVMRSKGNPAILESELRKLRTAPNLIMPSPEQDPIRFAQYYKHVQATQGPEAARALLHDYYRNNALREMKREMIPSISSR